MITTPVLAYTCSYEKGLKSCKKTFPRQCDLRQHQKNHTRPFHCPRINCISRFPSPKDVERHENSVHNKSSRYCCPYERCTYTFELKRSIWYPPGFPRKDHWLKHLKKIHSSSKAEVKAFREAGIPTARKEGNIWVLVVRETGTIETKTTEDRRVAISEVGAFREAIFITAGEEGHAEVPVGFGNVMTDTRMSEDRSAAIDVLM